MNQQLNSVNCPVVQFYRNVNHDTGNFGISEMPDSDRNVESNLDGFQYETPEILAQPDFTSHIRMTSDLKKGRSPLLQARNAKKQREYPTVSVRLDQLKNQLVSPRTCLGQRY